MLPTSIIIACGAAWAVCAIFLVIIMVRLNKAAHYFYVPADTQRSLAKVAPATGGPASKFGPLPRGKKEFHRQRFHGRKR